MIRWKPAKSSTATRSVTFADTSEGRFAIIGNYYFAGGSTLYTVTHNSNVVTRNIHNFVEATRIAEAHLTKLKEGK